jgi:Histidine kinase-, DNA gyrase B-, and HSP90-like ATPase
VEDTGAGMSQARVDALFRELEEVGYGGEHIEMAVIERDPFGDEPAEDTTDRAALGLGLAVVARTIRNMNGQLRLKTEEGKGSRFVIQLGFEIAGLPLIPQYREDIDSAPRSSPSTSSYVEGEVLLVDGSVSKKKELPGFVRRDSKESMNSMTSNKSRTSVNSLKSTTSQKSDVDRLIDAIKEPHLHTGDEESIQRRGSKEKASRASSADHDISLSRTKAKSIDSAMVRDSKSSLAKISGQERAKDSGTPIKPVRIVEENKSSPGRASRLQGKVVFDVSEMPMVEEPNEEPLSADAFSILVAEDDPINSRIIKRRLEKLGHKVRCTVNGEECASAHGEDAASFDTVLMDLQVCMPCPLDLFRIEC